MIYKVSGFISFIYPIEKFGKDKRVKRRIILDVGNPIENRTEHIVFDFMDGNVNLLQECEVGTVCELDFYLCGRKFIGDNNRENPACYVNLCVLNIKML